MRLHFTLFMFRFLYILYVPIPIAVLALDRCALIILRERWTHTAKRVMDSINYCYCVNCR